jgi:hypothetical protein
MVKQKRDYEVKKELVALFLFAQYKYILCLKGYLNLEIRSVLAIIKRMLIKFRQMKL